MTLCHPSSNVPLPLLYLRGKVTGHTTAGPSKTAMASWLQSFPVPSVLLTTPTAMASLSPPNRREDCHYPHHTGGHREAFRWFPQGHTSTGGGAGI